MISAVVITIAIRLWIFTHGIFYYKIFLILSIMLCNVFDIRGRATHTAVIFLTFILSRYDREWSNLWNFGLESNISASIFSDPALTASSMSYVVVLSLRKMIVGCWSVMCPNPLTLTLTSNNHDLYKITPVALTIPPTN